MKKIIIAICFLIILLITCTCVFANGTDSECVDALYSMGLIENTEGLDENVTNLEFASLFGKIVGNNIKDAAPRDFADIAVNNDLVKAFYINVLEREKDALFENALRAAIKLSGYTQMYPFEEGNAQSYVMVANKAGILKGVTGAIGEGITKETLYKLVYNALTVPIYNVSSYVADENGNIIGYRGAEKNSKTVLNTMFGVYIYQAEFYLSDTTSNIISGKIIQSENDYAEYKSGDSFSKRVKDTICAWEYEYTTGTVWINNNEIVNIIPDTDYKILYTYIDEVNGVDEKNAKFLTSAIKTITPYMYEKSIKVSDDCTFSYNGDEVYNSYIYLNRHFAKIVINANKIISVSSYYVNEGGLVMTATDDTITYSKGTLYTNEINSLNNYQKKIVITPDGVCDFSAIKENVVFDYIESGDLIIFLVGKNKVSGTFESYSDDEVYINSDGLNYGKNFTLYAAPDIYFRPFDSVSKKLLNCEVDAHLGFLGDARYILVTSQGRKSEIWAFALDYIKEGKSEEFTLAEFTGTTVDTEEKIYKVSEKVTVGEGLTFDYVAKEAASVYGGDKELNDNLREADNFYKFHLNSDNEIVKIERIPFFEGYDATGLSLTRLPYWGDYFVGSGINKVYFDNAPIMALYFDDIGNLKTMTFKYTQFNGHVCDLKVNLYCDNDESELDLMLFRGDVENITSGGTKTAMIIGKSLVSENDEVFNMYKMLIDNQQTERKVLQSEDIKMPEQALAWYKTVYWNEDKSIEFTGDYYDISTSPESWQTVLGTEDGMHHGEVERINTRKIFFKDGTSLYYNSNNIYEITSKKGKNKFEKRGIGAINNVNSVWYYILGSEVRYIFYK